MSRHRALLAASQMGGGNEEVRVIKFYVNGNEHTAENWMTWQDFVDSKYNTYLPSNIIDGDGLKWFITKYERDYSYPAYAAFSELFGETYLDGHYSLFTSSWVFVYSTDKIIENEQYNL